MSYVESNTFGYFIGKTKETEQKILTLEDEDFLANKGNNWKTVGIPFTIVHKIEEDEAAVQDEQLYENCFQIFLSDRTQKAHSQIHG